MEFCKKIGVIEITANKNDYEIPWIDLAGRASLGAWLLYAVFNTVANHDFEEARSNIPVGQPVGQEVHIVPESLEQR